MGRAGVGAVGAVEGLEVEFNEFNDVVVFEDLVKVENRACSRRLKNPGRVGTSASVPIPVLGGESTCIASLAVP